LEKWVKKRKAPVSAANDERALKTDVLLKWKDRKVKDIRRRDAILLLEEIAERAPGTAQYVLKVCRKMFSFALQREIVEFNAFAGITSAIPELAPKKKERTLSADEIRAIWSALDTGIGDDSTKRILKLILITAQRPGEVAGIRKSEIVGNWWTLPPERTKTRKEHRVFLTDLALSILPETTDDSDFYFPSPRGNKPIAVNALAHAVRRTDDPNKDIIKGRDGKERDRREAFYGLTPWTPHDLRRTARTFFAEIGVLRDHAEAVLNHVLSGVEGTYNRYHYDREKQLALETWTKKLKSIL
jgi:integrase